MSGTININCINLESAVKQMERAYGNFSIITENGFNKEIDVLEGMNSDFVEKLARVLEMEQEWEYKKLKNNIKYYVSTAQRICEEMIKIDRAMAGKEGEIE